MQRVLPKAIGLAFFIASIVSLGCFAVPARAIEGGGLADGTESKWSVALQILSTEDSGWMKCSGSFISQNWVLTAGHCVTAADLDNAYASVGSHINYNWPYEAKQIKKHPFLDVALVQLDKPGVARLQFSREELHGGELVEAFGFGPGINLKSAQLRSLGQPGDGFLYARPNDNNISEVGDSGGPLVYNGKIYGVLSAAVQSYRGNLQPEDYKYVPTAKFAQWIFENTSTAPAEGANWQSDKATTPKLGETEKNSNMGTAPVQSAATNRISGPNRVATSLAAWDQGGFTGTSVVIATGDKAADALAAGPLAAALDAPLVLSNGPAVEAATVSRILARGIHDVHLVGGQIHFDTQTMNYLLARGVAVNRIYGPNRYATATAVARLVGDLNVKKGLPDTPVLLADGIIFPDALSAGAGAAYVHGVVVLSAGAAMPSETAEYLRQSANPTTDSVFPIGGPAVKAWSKAGISGFRYQTIQGRDRYQTAQLVAQVFAAGATSAVVASGLNFPDGLSAAPFAFKRGSCLLLSNPHRLSAPTAARLGQLPARGDSLVIGGPGALSDAVAWAVKG